MLPYEPKVKRGGIWFQVRHYSNSPDFSGLKYGEYSEQQAQLLKDEAAEAALPKETVVSEPVESPVTKKYYGPNKKTHKGGPLISRKKQEAVLKARDALYMIPVEKITQALGINPGEIIPMSDLKSGGQIEWTGDAWRHLELVLPSNQVLEEQLRIVLKSIPVGKGLCVLPLLLSEPEGASTGVIALSKSILLTRESSVAVLAEQLRGNFGRILEQYTIDNILGMVFKCRELTFLSNPVEKTQPVTIEQALQAELCYAKLEANAELKGEEKDMLYPFFSSDYLPTTRAGIEASRVRKMPGFKVMLQLMRGLASNIMNPGEFMNIIYNFVDSLKTNWYKFNGLSFTYTLVHERSGNIRYDGVVYRDGKEVLKFTDELNVGGSIKRTIINKTVFYNLEGVQIQFVTSMSGKSIKRGKKDAEFSADRIISYDLEAYQEKGSFVPYAAGWYNGSEFNSYYTTEYANPDEMIIASFDAILSNLKNNGFVVYVHNLSNFDSLFMLKALAKSFKIDPFFHNNSLFSLDVSKRIEVDGKFVTVKIKVVDSFKMLSFPLRKLAESFEVTTLKGVFPYRFVTKDNLNYTGVTPGYNFYESKDISLDAYNQLVTNNWSIYDETLKYLESDVKSLFEVISKFGEEMFELEGVDITKSLTIASLALRVFKTNYLSDNTFLSKVRGVYHNEIRSAYYGGRVDVIKPHGKNLYYYDVNSLYPAAMLNPMPVGSGASTSEKDLNKLFGVVYADIVCPNDISIPILPFRTKDGSLINPKGSWSGWYFSEELKMAVKYGYTVKVLNAIVFEKQVGLFEEYVNKYYEIKSNATGPQRAIAKLMLNSLYGRMGLRPTFEVTKLVTTEQANAIMSNYDVTDSYVLNADKKLEVIRYSTVPSLDKARVSGSSNFLEMSVKADSSARIAEQSVPVAIAITAYARMLMNPYFIEYSNSIYYTDTDSIVMSEQLPSEVVGNDLGQFKLEHSGFEGYFPGCKVYALLHADGKVTLKAKTVGKSIQLHDVIDLCKGDSVSINKQFWERDRKAGTVTIVDKNINLSSVLLKREKVFDEKGVWFSTKPLIVNGTLPLVDNVVSHDVALSEAKVGYVTKLASMKADYVVELAENGGGMSTAMAALTSPVGLSSSEEIVAEDGCGTTSKAENNIEEETTLEAKSELYSASNGAELAVSNNSTPLEGCSSTVEIFNDYTFDLTYEDEEEFDDGY